MKILIYSDLHLSASSSIQRKKSVGKRLSNRLSSIIAIRSEIQDIAKEHKVEMIIDGGDLLNSDVLTSEELEGLTEFLKINNKISEYHINGNHGLVESSMNSASIVDVAEGHYFVNQITNIPVGNKQLTLVPYGFLDDSVDTIISSRKTVAVITHETFVDKNLQKIIKVSDSMLKLQRSSKVVFNGHIHNPGDYKGIYNIGSSSGCNFGDGHDINNPNTYPRVLLFDTDTKEIQSIILKRSNIFFNLDRSNIDKLKDLESTHNIYVNMSIKDNSDRLSQEEIVNYNIDSIVYSYVTSKQVSEKPVIQTEVVTDEIVSHKIGEFIKELVVSKYGNDKYDDLKLIGGEVFNEIKEISD